MGYVITDGKRYISTNGSIKTVTNIRNATKFTREKAENVLKSIPNKLKIFNWRYVYLGDVQDKSNSNSLEDYQGLTDNILEKMMDWENYIIKLQEYIIILNKQLSLVDKELSDVRHYVEDEKTNLNMYQAWKLYKFVQNSARKRRNIKNERLKAEYILNSNFMDCTNKAISNYLKSLDNRKYRPRILKELFDA